MHRKRTWCCPQCGEKNEVAAPVLDRCVCCGWYGDTTDQKWTATARDEYMQRLEPPGSYGLCWKLYATPEGAGSNCTKKLNHGGDCGKGDP
jgi:hypothetical protein